MLIPLLAGGGALAAGAGSTAAATLFGGALSYMQARSAQQRQDKFQRDQRQALAASQAQQQQAYRDTLRSSRANRGTGDFRADGGGILGATLKQVTGR